ncbi:MAG: hypothetical protein F4Y99_13355 [Acidimicrobiaceae bacterium]|nr:hypothetical protein [Acidimicrobiaceae bacterium]MDE0516755.1 hypothetical protein [Acidimicrobiaceae bacterium]MXZ96900.1 hypothetical protein [Acidimicrobiaceae bacterium]MYF42948.1 hypothetical protein [Acidimicrobiaceae bacterium]
MPVVETAPVEPELDADAAVELDDDAEVVAEALVTAEPVAEEPVEPAEAAVEDEAVEEELVEYATVRFVSQNILHGVGCSLDSDSCAVTERVALFMDQLVAAGCPELVSVQEANERIVGLMEAGVDACGYEVVWDGDPGLDREVVLTTLEVVGAQRRVLADRFRSAYLVRVASPIGVVDFLTTHLASGSDDRACSVELCPPPCDPAGSLRTCQARQVLEFAREAAVPGGATVVGGDLNDIAGSPTLAVFEEASFVDSHLAAGHPECDAATGAGCTAGRDDTTLADMADPASLQHRRIDYLLFSAPGRDCAVAGGTGLFNAKPAPGELAFPSDHTGVALALVCVAAAVDPAASDLALPDQPEPPTGPGGQPVDPVTAQAITTAFEVFFDGSIADIEARIDQIEDFVGMREAARLTFESSGDTGAAVRGRVDSISRTSSTTAEVAYSILLNDQVIFDGRIGEAVLAEGRWLVSMATFCDLVALSPVASEIDACLSRA